MPPRIGATTPITGLSRLVERRKESAGRLYFCPSCSTWRRTSATTRTTRKSSCISSSGGILSRQRDNNHLGPAVPPNSWRRLASALATSSAINVNRNVPARFRELYVALEELREAAADQISLSRLQLAQRGLESEDPVIRVAILGLNDASSTRRLVRLLLADPLTPRESWEDLLESYGAEASQGLLLRYGEESGIIENNLLPTISVPSSLLKKGNIEILVSSLGAGAEPSGVPITEETFLVPTITIPTSDTGRYNAIRYPVHRAIVCGSGTDGLLAYSGLAAGAKLQAAERSVHGAIELKIDEQRHQTGSRVSFVDTKLADEALAQFRESVQNASAYEHGWTGSGVQSILDWLSSTAHDKNGLAPDLEILVRSLLDAAETGISAREAQRVWEQQLVAVPEEVRRDLDRTVSAWAERSHIELRNSLDQGFASKRWRGLAWWKLFWRVDDVGMVACEILQSKYLPHAEKEMIWTAGRVQQAGLLKRSPDSDNFLGPSRIADTSDSVPQPEEMKIEQPWPAQISASRSLMALTTVPSLQALSQGLVLFSVSTTGLAGALSALLYASASTGYEAGTALAVGLIYSLRRQQKRWETARTYWEKEVRETGRSALKETEEHLRTLIRDGERQQEGLQDLPEMRAKAIIARARQALEDVKRS